MKARDAVLAGAFIFVAAVAAAPRAEAADARITVKNFAFQPAVLTVKPGTEIVWTNEDNEVHALKSAEGPAPFQSPALQQGDKFAHRFAQPGRYKYFCLLHPQMVGTIVVK
jgi:plastocyanin